MTPSSWTTDEQHIFLQGWLSEYQQHMERKDYHRFWPLVFTAWFTKWSEREILLLSIQDPLSPKQTEALGAAAEAHHKQLRTWFRWCTNGSCWGCIQQKRTSIFDAAIEPKGSHILSQSEIYLAECYDDRIKPHVDAVRSTGQLNSCGEVLHAVHQLSKELLEGEDHNIKEKVEEIYKAQKKSKTNEKTAGLTDLADIQCAIDDLLYALACVAQLIKVLLLVISPSFHAFRSL
ncbi:hypothetical protein V8E55_008486 [Tylopilus felleus]